MSTSDSWNTPDLEKTIRFNQMVRIPRKDRGWVTITCGTPSLATKVSAESATEDSFFDLNQLSVYSSDSFIARQLGMVISA